MPTFLYKFQQSTVLISSIIDFYILSNFFWGGISDQNWRSEIQRDDDSYQRLYPAIIGILAQRKREVCQVN